MQTLAEWKEKEPIGGGKFIDRLRKYTYEEGDDFIQDYEHGKPTAKIPLKMLADMDPKPMRTEQARLIVNFAKKKLGKK